MSVHDYIRERFFPHMWCAGCGHGTILNGLIRAVDELGIRKRNLVMVTGIGCSARISGYVDFHSLHTIHGRALAFATGVKLSRPELNVIVPMGDGDGLSIGGNHFIHAARRNINLTVVLFNNNIYGMTGGQYSPLTPVDSKASTAPYGTIERNFDITELAKAAGATFVARATCFHKQVLVDAIAKGIANDGFSLVEAITQCPISYGRQNKRGNAPQMMQWQKEHAVPVAAAAKMTPEQLEGKFTIGVLHESKAPEYTREYDKVIAKAQKGGK